MAAKMRVAQFAWDAIKDEALPQDHHLSAFAVSGLGWQIIKCRIFHIPVCLLQGSLLHDIQE